MAKKILSDAEIKQLKKDKNKVLTSTKVVKK
jgi:hypothetical protein